MKQEGERVTENTEAIEMELEYQRKDREDLYDIGEYRVFFQGLEDGTSEEHKREIVAAVAAGLSLTPFKANELVEGRNVVLKSNLNAEDANEYSQKLADFGLETVIIGMDQPLPIKKAARPAAKTKSAPAATPTAAPAPATGDTVTITCLSCEKVRNRVRASQLPTATCTVCQRPIAPENKFPAVIECRFRACKAKNRVKTRDALAAAKCAKCGHRLTA